MTNFLKTLRLIQDMNFELPANRPDFVKALQANVDPPGSPMRDIFSRSKHIYKGIVTYDGFDLKRKRKFFDSNMGLVTARGTFTQGDDNLTIDVQFKAFHPLFILFFIFLVLSYGMFIVMFAMAPEEGGTPAWTLPFILVHASFMFGIPYFLLRRSISMMKYNLERDFFFFIKDKLNPARP